MDKSQPVVYNYNYILNAFHTISFHDAVFYQIITQEKYNNN